MGRRQQAKLLPLRAEAWCWRHCFYQGTGMTAQNSGKSHWYPSPPPRVNLNQNPEIGKKYSGFFWNKQTNKTIEGGKGCKQWKIIFFCIWAFSWIGKQSYQGFMLNDLLKVQLFAPSYWEPMPAKCTSTHCCKSNVKCFAAVRGPDVPSELQDWSR